MERTIKKSHQIIKIICSYDFCHSLLCLSLSLFLIVCFHWCRVQIFLVVFVVVVMIPILYINFVCLFRFSFISTKWARVVFHLLALHRNYCIQIFQQWKKRKVQKNTREKFTEKKYSTQNEECTSFLANWIFQQQKIYSTRAATALNEYGAIQCTGRLSTVKYTIAQREQETETSTVRRMSEWERECWERKKNRDSNLERQHRALKRKTERTNQQQRSLFGSCGKRHTNNTKMSAMWLYVCAYAWALSRCLTGWYIRQHTETWHLCMYIRASQQSKRTERPTERERQNTC